MPSQPKAVAAGRLFMIVTFSGSFRLMKTGSGTSASKLSEQAFRTGLHKPEKNHRLAKKFVLLFLHPPEYTYNDQLRCT